MCDQCNYEKLLVDATLEVTTNRVRVLEILGDNKFPLSAGDIYNILARTSSINRVTVYRILDRLVAHGVADRISTGGRAFYYGIASNSHHRAHPHFYCTVCGQMDCLHPDSLTVDTAPLWKSYPGRIDKVEVRVDGICKNCEKLDAGRTEK